MRIAHFIHRYPPALGGAESYFARLSQWLVAQGDEVEVFTTNAFDLEAFWTKQARTLPVGLEVLGGVRVHRHPISVFPLRRYLLKGLNLVPWPRWQAYTLPCNPISPGLWSAAGQGKDFQLVHASAFPYAWPILCGLRLARRLKVPFVLTPFLHLGDPARPDRTRRQYLSPALRGLLREADGIFVQTHSERQAALELGLPEVRVWLQGLGVEPSECTGGDRQRGNERWKLPDTSTLRIGHLANLSEEKGTCDLLRALRPLWKRGLNIQAVLAGPSMPNFERFWAGLPEEERRRVNRLGVLKDEEKADFYAAIDVFALPSSSDSFGLVLLEAWANRVPCVGYRAGGIAEVIRHEENGLLAACGDVAGLTLALERLARHSELRDQLGMSGRERVLVENCWEPKLRLVRERYEELIQLTRARLKKAGARTGGPTALPWHNP